MKPEYETPKGTYSTWEEAAACELTNNPDDVVLEEMRQQVFKEVSQKHFDEWLAAASNPIPHWGTK